MYKIVLCDANTPAFSTRTVEYYVDDIETFQKEWFLIERDQNKKDRFLKCKEGEYQSDFPGAESQNLCMIQVADDYKCLHERIVEYHDIDAKILNGYYYPSFMHIKHMKIYYRFICFKGKVKRIARFELKGICRDALFERISGNELIDVYCYGNTVIKVKNKYYGPADSNNKSDYDGVEMESIAYKGLWTYEVESFEVSEELFTDEEQQEDLQLLLEDIVGLAG